MQVNRMGLLGWALEDEYEFARGGNEDMQRLRGMHETPE